MGLLLRRAGAEASLLVFAACRLAETCSLRRKPAVLPGIPVTLRCSRRWSAVHPASAVRHRWRLAPAPASGPGQASGAQVHSQFAAHEIVLLSWQYPPRSIHVAHYGLPTRVHVNMLHRHFLLTLASMAVALGLVAGPAPRSRSMCGVH